MRRMPSKRNQNFSLFIDSLIQKYDGKPDSIIQVNNIANETGVEKRRLYDLMNVLVACEICTKADTHLYRWNGIHAFNTTLKKIAKEVELKAMHTDIEHLFLIPDSPTIGSLTTQFLGAYTYLGIPSMNIRDAALLMSIDEDKAKPILRRLYLVAYLLEHIGIFKHASKIGEYEISADVIQISKETFSELQNDGEFNPKQIEFCMNRFDSNYLNATHSERREDFVRQLHLKTSQTNDLMTGFPIIPTIQGIDI